MILRCAFWKLLLTKKLIYPSHDLDMLFFLDDVEIHDDLSCVGMNKNPRDRHKQQHSQHDFNSNKNRIVRTLIERFVKSSSRSSPYIEAFLFNLYGKNIMRMQVAALVSFGNPWKPWKLRVVRLGCAPQKIFGNFQSHLPWFDRRQVTLKKLEIPHDSTLAGHPDMSFCCDVIRWG